MTNFVPMNTGLICKNINQPYTGGNAKYVLASLTSHLTKKSQLPNCILHYLFIHLYENYLLPNIYRADTVLGSKDSIIGKEE